MSGYSRLSAVAIVLGAMACTKHDQSDAGTTPATTQAPPAASAINTITVTARDFAFDAPTQIPAGLTTVHLVNQGKEIHHVQILKFAEGKTLADFMAALKAGGPLPAWVTEVGGPNAPAPGGDATATVALDSGSYAFVCFVDLPDHVPHVMKGMSKEFVVTPATNTAAVAEPASDMSVTLSDYTFTLSQPFTAGTHTVRVENSAQQPHEIEIVQLAPGKTLDDMLKWAGDPKGSPPGRPIGGMTGLSTGRHGFFTVDLPAGEYALICFYPDMKDGKPHFMHGMKKQFTIS